MTLENLKASAGNECAIENNQNKNDDGVSLESSDLIMKFLNA